MIKFLEKKFGNMGKIIRYDLFNNQVAVIGVEQEVIEAKIRKEVR